MYTNKRGYGLCGDQHKSPLYKRGEPHAWMFLGLLLTFLTCVLGAVRDKTGHRAVYHGGCRLRFWSQSWRSLSLTAAPSPKCPSARRAGFFSAFLC